MEKIKIGIICPSEIAFRRFLPSLHENQEFEYVGVAIASIEEWTEGGGNNSDFSQILLNEKEKAVSFVNLYGGVIWNSYRDLLESNDVDAIYLPLPPALHYKWAKLALEYGKHILVEKPFTTSLKETETLIAMAKEKDLAVHENYMFLFHDQITAFDAIVDSNKIGEVRHYKISFGFPRRSLGDFRYNKQLGGGALYDCGGYTIKYAHYLLGKTARMLCASSYYETDCDVDIFGSATMINEKGVVAQLSFGMDNNYKCDVEAWGSQGTLKTKRIFTAPNGYTPEVKVKVGQNVEHQSLPPDESFSKSITHFYKTITEESYRLENYKKVTIQASFINMFEKLAGR